MSIVSRRTFLLATTALPVGCALESSSSRDDAAPTVRAPAVGQSWRYAVHDLYTGAVIDTQLDTVAAIDRTIDIDSRSEGAPRSAARSGWGMDWLSKYMGGDGAAPGPLPSEVQAPWGMVLVDPHWGRVQVYERPVPLWPTALAPGWHERIVTRYKTPKDADGLAWDQTMRAHAWERITVPAGTFRALRYSNTVHFVHGDFGRDNSTRNETLWFAPEVGRWVARESRGRYFPDESVDDTPVNESGHRWELLAWT